jgi:UDP-glucose 4-epimerase
VTGVLVTGATTPLGCHLVAGLAAKAPISARCSRSEQKRSPRRRSTRGRRVWFTNGWTWTRAREIQQLLFGPAKKLRLSCLIHTALHRSATDDGPRVHALNVDLTRELLDAAERHPSLKHFVFRSHGDVYRIDPRRAVLLDEQDTARLFRLMRRSACAIGGSGVSVCTRMGLSRLSITVLRCSEILAPEMGSQLHDYLASRVCLRPFGFDPMLNLLSLEDAVRALMLALESDSRRDLQRAGADTLPLKKANAPRRQNRARAAGPAARAPLRGTRVGLSA